MQSSGAQKAALLLADGFDECEAFSVIDLLRKAGIPLVTAAAKEDTIVRSARGVSVRADSAAADLRAEELCAVVLPGGAPGVENLTKSEAAQRLTTALCREGRLVAAVCGGPVVLARWDLLQGRRATVFPALRGELDAHGAEVIDRAVTADGNLITGRSMGASISFALALIARLSSPEQAIEIARSIYYDDFTAADAAAFACNNDQSDKR